MLVTYGLVIGQGISRQLTRLSSSLQHQSSEMRATLDRFMRDLNVA